MSRSRNLKPGFFRNPELSTVSPLTRIFFQGLWCEADRRGIVEDRPKKLKADILPYDKANPEAMLENLESLGFIQRYEVDGVRCILITKFTLHQNPHRDEKESTLPAPCQHRANTVQDQGKTGTDREDSLNTDSLSLDSSSAPDGDDPRPLPEHGDAQTIVARFCEAAGIERPASYPKAAGIAREIAKAGVRPEQIADLYTFTASRWKGRADLGKMLNAIDEWRSKPVHPPPQNGHGPKFTLEDELAYRRQRGMDVPKGVGT